MPNTTLPTDVTAGTGGHANMHQVTNRELNRMSRDTGWRDIRGLFRNGWAADVALIRRVDEDVTLHLGNLDGSAASSMSSPIFMFGFDESNELSLQFTPDAPFSIRLPTFESTAVGMRVHFYMSSGAGGFYASFSEGSRTGGPLLQVNWKVHRGDGWPSFLPPEA